MVLGWWNTSLQVFLNDFKPLPIIGSDKNLKQFKKKYKYAHISIGQIKNPKVRKNMYDNRLPQYIKTPPKIRSTYPIKPQRISEPFPMKPLHSMIQNNPSQQELNTLRPMV